MLASVWLSLGFSLLLPPARPVVEPIEACSLIPGAAIEAVQGEPVVAAKSSTPDRAVFAVAQCFYSLRTFTKSVSLELTRPDPESTGEEGPREYWRKVFHGEEESEEELEAPQPVGGVGDEAFWTGNGLVGALYVLEGDAYLRISVGGAEDAKIRIKKTKRLAKVALKHLQASLEEGAS